MKKERTDDHSHTDKRSSVVLSLLSANQTDRIYVKQ